MNEKTLDPYPDWGLLHAWVAVVESESVSEAARRLGLSQAAVSMRIKLLETKLHTVLLDRGTRPAKPTLAGRRLYEASSLLLRNADEMLESVRSISRAKRSVVRIGCVDSFAATVGPMLYRALSNTTQQVRLWAGLTPLLEAQFANRQLDILITTASGVHQDGVSRVPLFSEQYVVALPEGYALQPSCSFSDLGRQLPLIRYSARSAIGQQVDRFLEQHGDALERICEFDTTDPLLALVTAGIGFAITTPMCIWQSRHFASKLRVMPLESFRSRGKPYASISRAFNLAYRSGETGKLPKEIESLTRVVMSTQIAREMADTLGLPREVVWTAANSEE